MVTANSKEDLMEKFSKDVSVNTDKDDLGELKETAYYVNPNINSSDPINMFLIEDKRKTFKLMSNNSSVYMPAN